MNYENDYELIYLIREKDDYAFTYILNKYSKIINIICNKYYSKYNPLRVTGRVTRSGDIIAKLKTSIGDVFVLEAEELDN